MRILGLRGKRLLLLALSTAAALLLCEGGFRLVMAVRFELRASEWSHPLFEVEPHSRIEYTLKPMTTREIKFDPDREAVWSYTINAEGFRGGGGPRTAGIDQELILFLGDSYTFGWAVNDHETYPEQLRSIANESAGNSSYACLNMAVPGYNTVQQSGLIRRIPDHEPALVILGYVMNDAEPQKSVLSDPSKAYKYATSWVFEYLKRQLNHYALSDQPRFSVEILQYHYWYLDGFQPESSKWKDSRAALEEIAAHFASRKVPVMVLVFPDFTRPFDDSYPFTFIHEQVAGWCAALDLEVLDLWDHFEGLDNKEYSVAGDGHPNAAAHRKIAEILFGRLNGAER